MAAAPTHRESSRSSGIDHIESRSLPGVSIIKVFFGDVSMEVGT
jgi:hypothetical protein